MPGFPMDIIEHLMSKRLEGQERMVRDMTDGALHNKDSRLLRRTYRHVDRRSEVRQGRYLKLSLGPDSERITSQVCSS
jgi:hypothetical protein